MKNKPNIRRILKWTGIIIAILIVLICAELIYSNYALTVSRYAVSSAKAAGSFRIVFLSDLHGREFGKDNSRLLKKIAEEEPDIIALVGDIINNNADDDEVERMCAFITAASKLAPVYSSMGNHEYGYMQKHATSLTDRITEAGAVVLDSSYLDIEINGTPVRIGGYEGYYRTPHMTSSDPERQAADFAFFDDFENTDRLKLLLNHIPTNWLDWDYRDKTPVDLVLSGHYHGGVVRIPIIEKGLFAPYVGKFPPYTKGVFEGKKATCILSAGMAGSSGVPRFFNPPEIVTVDISPEKP